MERTQKHTVVDQLSEEFRTTPHIFLTHFRGLTVNQANELRSKVREAGGTYRVIKNRLAKLAAAGTPAESLLKDLTGPSALAWHPSDPVALAKALAEFAKAHPELDLVGALLEAKDTLDQEGVKKLAALPGMQELRAQLLALIQTPATTLVRLLNTPGGQVARALDAWREKQEAGD